MLQTIKDSKEQPQAMDASTWDVDSRKAYFQAGVRPLKWASGSWLRNLGEDIFKPA